MIFPRDHKLWPCYVSPYEDELFSSWLIRLSSSHLLKSHTFSKIFFDNTPIWNRDIDIACPGIIKKGIMTHSTLTERNIDTMFIKSYEGILFETLSLTHPIISRLGIVHRKRKHHGILFCPGCLDKENIYFRKSWRLKTSLVCPDCNLKLLSACPVCSSPICYHRLENGYRDSYLKYPLSLCFNCKKDLRSGKPWCRPSEIEANYQKYINETILNGYNGHTQYSFEYFSMLINIQHQILSSSTLWGRFRNAVKIKYKKEFISDRYGQPDQESNNQAILIAYELLDEWPDNFINFCSTYNIRYSDVAKDIKRVPFFMYDIFKGL